MPISPLLDADEPEHSRLSRRSFVDWDITIIERFIHDNHDRDQANRVDASCDPESQRPCMFPEDEPSYKGSQIRGDDDAPGPDVDFPTRTKKSLVAHERTTQYLRTFVEKEQIVDPHQATLD